MREAYDVVIIGGGHNGLVVASELARAGRSVCVAEAHDGVGGCAITHEPLLPGFRHSPHANCFLYADIMLPEIAPAGLGLEVIQPEAQLGVAFADGRSPVILHRPDLLAETRASLAVYSRADADTYVELKRRSADLGSVLRRGLYAAPNACWFDEQHAKVLHTFRRRLGSISIGQGTARQLIDRLFEAAEVRLLLYVLALETGVALEQPGSDLAFLGFSLWIAGRWRIPVGGMRAYSDALRRSAQAAGVDVLVSTKAAEVVVDQQRAIGIRTADGRRIACRDAVIAAVPVLEVFDRLLSGAHVAPAEQAEVHAFRQAAAPIIATSAFCLEGAPCYSSGRHDPDISRCLKTAIGFEHPEDVLNHIRDVGAGRLPRPAGIVRIHSQWDAAMAPSGKHLAAIDCSFPSAGCLDARTWGQVQATFPVALLAEWQRHLCEPVQVAAIGMSLGDTPGFERRMLMRIGDAQYRTSVRGLYLAGPGVYPGGGVHGACGHNAGATFLADQALPCDPVRPGGATARVRAEAPLIADDLATEKLGDRPF